ncbi:hypothetical protein [Bradyrhizobium sp. 33ap4]|uniref:hypothetical protein n=1 Tax=Bradyrhizobium sp. 33ap4 TaxID=3061630 RepID=UPI00292CFB7C|nr:hypothetical protein [Bradyrhizobium sp. 33ap4]
MGTLWLKDIKGGLDTRRMSEALPGGSAIRANDGHVSRGGEFEQRPAFVQAYSLPAGTIGLGATQRSLYVFGSGPAPATPRGVLYQQLQHPDGITPLYRIRAYDLFATKLYVVAEYEDGTIYHFYDGQRVTDWQDGRARFPFRVVAGGPQPAIQASCQFTVSGGSNSIVNTFGDIQIGGVSILGVPVQHTGNNTTTAGAIAAQINAYVSNPDYSAAFDGPVVTIFAITAGAVANGPTPTFVLNGDTAVSNVTAMQGGADAAPSQVADITVNGVSILAGPVTWATSNEATAQAIVDSINSYASLPDYTATAVGDRVNILAADPGVAANGFAVAFTLLRGMTFTPAGILSGGLDPGNIFQSGTFAKTIGSKEYVTNGQYLNFSAIDNPTGFQTTATAPDNTGAGFIDMSTQAGGSESLQALAKYQQWIAVFAERVTQIWAIDPDPTKYAQVQVLNNMGTTSPRSVTQFGDSDVFFLDESGVRSLRARDASNAASTSDVGVAVDTLVVDKIRPMSTADRSKIVGLIEPTSGRFWLGFKDLIVVLSFFEGSKISSWATYTPGVDGVPFLVDDYAVFKKKVYLRSGDTIYVFGGLGNDVIYDETSPELWTPYLDCGAPADDKQFRTLDVGCEGQWEVRVAFDPKNPNVSDKVAVVNGSTYAGDKIPFEHRTTHVSLRFKGVGAGEKKVSSAVIKFDGDGGE